MQSSKSTGCWEHLVTCLLLVVFCMNSCCWASNKFDDDIYEIKGEYTCKTSLFLASLKLIDNEYNCCGHFMNPNSCGVHCFFKAPPDLAIWHNKTASDINDNYAYMSEVNSADGWPYSIWFQPSDVLGQRCWHLNFDRIKPKEFSFTYRRVSSANTAWQCVFDRYLRARRGWCWLMAAHVKIDALHSQWRLWTAETRRHFFLFLFTSMRTCLIALSRQRHNVASDWLTLTISTVLT